MCEPSDGVAAAASLELAVAVAPAPAGHPMKDAALPPRSHPSRNSIVGHGLTVYKRLFYVSAAGRVFSRPLRGRRETHPFQTTLSRTDHI